MFRFPYLGFPYGYSYYNYPSNFYNNHIQKEVKNTSIKDSNESINTSTPSNVVKQKQPTKSDSEQPVFEILGIKLYLDDIIILCILFFLYKENVKDEMLYIILFLLLFS